MKKLLISLFVFLTINFSTFSQNNDDKSRVNIGNTEILIPAPRFGLVELGKENHHRIAPQAVPNTNRLLAVYYKPEELAQQLAGEKVWTSSYALIETVIEVENIDVSLTQFSQLIEESKKLVVTRWDTIQTLTKEVIRNRFGDLKDQKVELGKVEQLAVVQDTNDIFSYLLSMDVKLNDEVAKYVATATFMRTENKLLLVYLYRKYENPETILTLVNDTKEWNMAILLANPSGGFGSILRFLANLSSSVYLSLIGIFILGGYKLFRRISEKKEIEAIEKRIKESGD